VGSVEEVEAIDWNPYPGVRILYQTTLNAEDYEEVARAVEARARNVSRTDTICYATKENQDAAVKLASDPEVDLVLVIGGRHSANTRHLWEICQRLKPSYLIHDPEDLRPDWLEGAHVVGITAGASTPDYLVEEVEARIAGYVSNPCSARNAPTASTTRSADSGARRASPSVIAGKIE
jgi:4-hydroxy-3-methylbut-2-en-1-yl diphosphate reductase